MFSVVIVNWNTSALLENCLASIASQTSPTVEYEVIVVDNASSDDSRAMVRSKFPFVHLIENTSNVGYAIANNQGIQNSQGDYIVLLNSDTVLLNDVLSHLKQGFEQNPQFGILGVKLITSDGKRQRYVRGYKLSLLSAFNHYFFVSTLLPRNSYFKGLVDNHDYDALTEMDWVSGACLAVRRTVLEKIGMLNESLFMYSEDAEFCYRAQEAGYRVGYLPTALVKHYVSQSMKKQSSYTVQATPLYSRDLVFQQLYPNQNLFLFRLIVWAGYLLRSILWGLLCVVKPTQSRQFQRDQANLYARIAFNLLRHSDSK
jgi:GT2 family glycosyltransferase